MDFFTRLFDTSDFPPRWHCGNWTAGLGWLHILSDLGVWGAYIAIPCLRVGLPKRMAIALGVEQALLDGVQLPALLPGSGQPGADTTTRAGRRSRSCRR